MHLMCVSISGLNNCSRFARRKRKTTSDLFLLQNMSGKRGEIKRGEEACRAVCESLQIVWMKRHSCLSCLVIFFSFDYPFLLSSIHGRSSLSLHFQSLANESTQVRLRVDKTQRLDAV